MERALSSVFRHPRRRPRGNPLAAHAPASARDATATGHHSGTPPAARAVATASPAGFEPEVKRASTSRFAQAARTPAPSAVNAAPEMPCTWYRSARVHMRRHASRGVIARSAYVAAAAGEGVDVEGSESTTVGRGSSGGAARHRGASLVAERVVARVRDGTGEATRAREEEEAGDAREDATPRASDAATRGGAGTARMASLRGGRRVGRARVRRC